MKKKLIVLSACTNNKRHKAHPECCLDACSKGAVSASVKAWVESIQSSKFQRYAAERLYAGSHWKETLACVSAAQQRGLDPDLWVLSAGWGLIHSSLEISPYSATFSQGENSIHNLPWATGLSNKDKARIWWKEINACKAVRGPRSLEELLRFYPQTEQLFFLFIISKEYFQALEAEIVELAAMGGEVAVISAGLFSEIGSASPIIRGSVMPVSDKLKQADSYLNKTNVSLNARLATWIVTKHSAQILKGPESLRRMIESVSESLPEMKRKSVAPMTDDEVLGFIEASFIQGQSSATKMLKALRHDENKSCEQKRFGALFRQHAKKHSRERPLDV